MQEDVSSLEVTVSYTHLPQVLQALVHIDYQLAYFRISKLLSLALETFLEISLIAKFSDDVAIAIREERLVELDDVGVAHLLKNAYLLEDQLLEMFRLQSIQGDDLDGDYFICMRGGVRVKVLRPR